MKIYSVLLNEFIDFGPGSYSNIEIITKDDNPYKDIISDLYFEKNNRCRVVSIKDQDERLFPIDVCYGNYQKMSSECIADYLQDTLDCMENLEYEKLYCKNKINETEDSKTK